MCVVGVYYCNVCGVCVYYLSFPGKMTMLSVLSGKESSIFPTFESNFLITPAVFMSTSASSSYTRHAEAFKKKKAYIFKIRFNFIVRYKANEM